MEQAGKVEKSTAYTILVSMTAAVGGLLFGFDTSVISGAILFVREQFQLSPFEIELAVSAALVGAVAGSAIGGALGDRFGRKPILILTATLFAVFSLATGMAEGLVAFMAARFFVGLAVGITSMVTPLYIAEVAPSRIRGGLVSLNQLAIIAGIVIAYGVDYWFAESGNWQAMFISAVIPSIVLLFALLVLPESPRWLASRDRFDEARRILQRVESAEEVERNIRELQRVIEEDRLAFLDLFSPRFRKAVLVGVGLAVFQQITGVNTIIYYAPTILQIAGYESASSAILATALIGGVSFVATAVALFLMDRVGRRPLLLAGTVGMGLSLAHLGLSFGAQNVSRVSVLAAMLVYIAAFAIGLGPVFWLLISEIYPTTVRAQAMSLAAVTAWGSNLLVTATFLTLIDTLGPRGSFWLYSAFCVLAVWFTVTKVPETNGKTLEEIEASWT